MTGKKRLNAVLISLLLAWGTADAAGLGRLTVQSALGQPFRGEIELLSVNKDELPGIAARLASYEAFKQARVERTSALSSLVFKVDQRTNGQPIVSISSTAPISEAFLDILIELNWNSGRIIREYTVLLDPPNRAEPEQAPVAAPEATRPAPQPERFVAPEPTPPAPRTATPKPAQQKAEPQPDPKPEPKPEAQETRRYGPIKAGETLSGIARKVREGDISVEQMMVGLYQDNKAAFAGDNMNRLRKGQTLAIPDADSVRAIEPKQAARTITGHADAWHAYRSKVAAAAPELVEAKPADKAASGKVTAKADDKAAPAPAASKDVLKLSKGEPVGGKADAKGLNQQAAQEELAAKKRALAESDERVKQLERSVNDMQKLLAMKQPAPAPVPAKSASAPEPVKVAPPPSVPAPAAPAATPAPAPVAAPAPAKPPVVAAPAPVAPPPSDGGWFSTFLGNPLYIGGLVAALLLSGLLWMMMVGSRRKKGVDKFEDSIMTGGGEFKANSVFGNAPQPAGPATQGSMLTDFSRLGMGAIDTHEVDPIAEAEVYMAYGRDAQAEEILREAYTKDPNRRELALKLLEIYAARKDRVAFETTASELYASLGGEGTAEWQHAAEMGRSIDPDNPLYRAGAGDMSSTFPGVSLSRAAATAAPVAAASAAAFPGSDDFNLDATFPSIPEDVPQDLDSTWLSHPAFNLDETTAESPQPALASKDAEDGLDFDFGLGAASLPDAKDTDPLSTLPGIGAQPTAQDFSLDFTTSEFNAPAPAASEPALADFDLDMGQLESAQVEEPSVPLSPPSLDFSGIDLDLAQPDAGDLSFEDASPPATGSASEAAPITASEPDLEMTLSDFGMSFESAAVDTSAAEATRELEATLSGLEFSPASMPDEALDFAAPEPEPPAPEEGMDPALHEEVETKLDLARAYLEMGDKEGAREILEEVLAEGDGAQKGKAEKLLSEAA